ncbi:hypothetical protein F5Y13DRAFT_164468 [Hypoxylon sp. FL1857]|nr:hypothetical protein F5Y13DRAFT_164468 [Hypoxylon sp. FL1857]
MSPGVGINGSLALTWCFRCVFVAFSAAPQSLARIDFQLGPCKHSAHATYISYLYLLGMELKSGEVLIIYLNCNRRELRLIDLSHVTLGCLEHQHIAGCESLAC